MACACKVNQKIDYIHKKYGYKFNNNNKSNKIFIDFYIKNIVILLILILLFPIMFFYVLYKALFSKNKFINYRMFLKNKNKNGRKK